MAIDCPLLALPVELRVIILTYAFVAVGNVRLRTPSHRRLRPSRVAKHCPQGLLSTCHLLREESIPIFYSLTSLVFRSSMDTKEYLTDKLIDPFVKQNLKHLAIDDGGTKCLTSLWPQQLWLVSNAFELCTALKVLEFRIDAHNERSSAANLTNPLISDWKQLAARLTLKRKASDGNMATETREYEEFEQAAYHSLRSSQHKIDLTETAVSFDGLLRNSTSLLATVLVCCNILIAKNDGEEPALGNAVAAFETRKQRVGALRRCGVELDTDTPCLDRREVEYMREVEAGCMSSRALASHVSPATMGNFRPLQNTGPIGALPMVLQT